LEIGVTSFHMPEQQRDVAIKNVAAGAEIARRAAANVRFPSTGPHQTRPFLRQCRLTKSVIRTHLATFRPANHYFVPLLIISCNPGEELG
jgi:hypothetical protein